MSHIEELKNLRRRRGTIKSKLTTFKNHLKEVQDQKIRDNQVSLDELVSEDLKERTNRIKNLVDEFDEVQNKIEIIIEDTQLDNEYLEREEFEKSFFATIALAKSLLKTCINTSNEIKQINHSNSNLSAIKLPKISLPLFNGTYDQWIPFRDIFDSLIHENLNLSDIQKFHYLKSALKGDAVQIIDSLEISKQNYSVAWKLLKDRYENKRMIVQSHVKALFDLQPVVKESATKLRQLCDNFHKHLRALEALGQSVGSSDAITIHLLTSKLDPSTKRAWEGKNDTTILPTLDELKQFLSQRCQFLESLHSSNTNEQKVSYNSSHRFKAITSHTSAIHQRPCDYCKGDHYIYKCSHFLKLETSGKIQEAKRLKLCLNCLKPNHFLKDCTSSVCKICSRKHNTLLHFETSHVKQTLEEPSLIKNSSISTHCGTNNIKQVILSTAIVHIFDSKGQAHECRALLDSGSQSNFITLELCKKLKLNPAKIQMSVNGISQQLTKVTHQTDVKIKSKHNGFQTILNCLVLTKITQAIPNVRINPHTFKIPSNIKLADPRFYEPNTVDLLIGASLFYSLLCIGQIRLEQNQPIFQKTTLGWIVSGTITNCQNHNNSLTSQSICHLNTDQIDLQDQIERFWKQEEIVKVIISKENSQCEKHFTENVMRDTTGRYLVSLPFKNNRCSLGDSYTAAIKRFISVERRLAQNPQLKIEYNDFLGEYEALGHMSEISPESEPSYSSYYLPHHAVVKETRTTTKLRVVFDGSSKTSNNMSLNDNLLIGPTIQDDLFSILLRFRTHKYVLTADIEKMYRQINVKTKDRNYQKILWRKDPSDPIKIYTLNTVTYGTSCAPFLAIRCLKQLALDEYHTYPEASTILQSDFYVDDLLTGTSTIEHARILQRQLTELLAKGQFNLTKWRSNCQLTFQNKILHKEESKISLDKQDIQKTLGLFWNSTTDEIQYEVNIQELPSTKVTKRIMLSTIFKIYDPLGLIGPVLIIGKLIMQQLWQLKISWDESVPITIHSAWQELIEGLHNLNKLRIPRYIISEPLNITCQLLGFCDASQSAYGACIYIHQTNGEQITVRLFCSKSRVAPLKVISLPRLELCAALLLSQLIIKTKQAIRFNINTIHCWSDSTIVLSWLAMDPSKLKTYEANRVAEIQKSLPYVSWKHVSSKENPADIISRGMSPEKLLENNLWWSGPEWLLFPENTWPNHETFKNQENDVPQLEDISSFMSTIIYKDLFIRYSSFQKLQRVYAYILRFLHNAKSQNNLERRFGYITCKEIQLATKRILLILQNQHFSKERTELLQNKIVSKQSKLATLNPFIDTDGLIRVGGRLVNSSLPTDRKHQIVLPYNDHVTKIIFRDEHIFRLHCGEQALLSYIRLKYWPLSGRRLAKHIIHNCIICYKCKPRPTTYLMGNLPQDRVQLHRRPFYVCGVDFCGPFQMKEPRLRGRIKITKLYLAIFICFSTKAVHLELVCDLTAQAFLAALRRFISRRGLPSDIYSDNGTNFVRANKDLKELYSFLSSQEETITNECIKQSINWHFIPPRSPHFGGLWEAAVKSAKTHLHRILKSNILTYEEFNTVIIQIEACLNSRPLTPLSTDPNDLNVLTPSHFIIGDSLFAPPEQNLENVKDNLLSKWQHLQKIRQHFWKRWSREYLHQLQQRPKGLGEKLDIKVGALVLLIEENIPPQRWMVGRVIELIPGTDNVTRVAIVKTNTGIYKRALRKLCFLPMSNE